MLMAEELEGKVAAVTAGLRHASDCQYRGPAGRGEARGDGRSRRGNAALLADWPAEKLKA
jgi:hypothetical protein